MKKLVYASLLSMGLSISAFAITTPNSTRDNNQVPPQYSGVKACIIDNSTGTTSLLCTAGGTVAPYIGAGSSGPITSGIILDIIASSVATTDNIVVRDTNIANTTNSSTGGLLMYIDGNSVQAKGGLHVFPRFKAGLNIQAQVAPGTSVGNTQHPAWTVIYTTDLY